MYDDCAGVETRRLFKLLVHALTLAGCVLCSGCALPTQLTIQEPSATGQLLLVRSLDRAIAQLDVRRLVGHRVDVDLIAQSGNKDFARELLKKRLRERGVQVSSDDPEEKLQVFATVLGTDRGDTLIGTPAMSVPIFGGFPEVAIFRWVRNRGLAELELDSLKPKTDELIDHFGPVVGSSKRDDYTLLIFITFSVTDAVAGR